MDGLVRHSQRKRGAPDRPGLRLRRHFLTLRPDGLPWWRWRCGDPPGRGGESMVIGRTARRSFLCYTEGQ
jgi:hypothetical protein